MFHVYVLENPKGRLYIGQVGDWSRFDQLKAQYLQTHWILAGGLSPSNVLEVLAQTRADHLDLNGGVKSAVGV
jgi:phosphoribosylanthranilate isomerase